MSIQLHTTAIEAAQLLTFGTMKAAAMDESSRYLYPSNLRQKYDFYAGSLSIYESLQAFAES